MTEYLPWWITSISLAIITLGFYLANNKTLGVAGSWTRVVQFKNDRELNEAHDFFASRPKMFEDALMAATIQHFGKAEVTRFLEARHKQAPDAEAQQPAAAATSRNHWSVHMVFLGSLVVGGLIGAVIRGDLGIQMDMGSVHSRLFGEGFAYVMTLFVGGCLVGFGTQLAGGCTSGHGLSGASRLVPASLVATMSFFGAAVIFSMALHYLG